jgi:hypothetical protein
MSLRVAAIMTATVLLPRLASACPVCFGASDGPILRGSSMGILALLVITIGMLGAFGAFFMTLARRGAKSAATGSEAGVPRQSAHAEMSR